MQDKMGTRTAPQWHLFHELCLDQKVSSRPVFGQNNKICPHQWEQEKLHGDVLDMVSTVINEAFGTSLWYKYLKKDLAAVPVDRLLPGILCSAVWFTSNPKPYRWHDWMRQNHHYLK